MLKMTEEVPGDESPWPADPIAVTEGATVSLLVIHQHGREVLRLESDGAVVYYGERIEKSAAAGQALVRALLGLAHPAAPQTVVHHKTPPIVSDMTLKFTAVPLVQPEPAGYFERWDGHWDQVAAEFNDDADVYPLYLHPPATEVQRLIDAAKSVWDSAVAHDRVLNRHTKVSPVALDCLRAALDALEGM